MADISPRRAVDLSPKALLSAGVTGALAVDVGALETGRWTLATRAEDLSPAAVRYLGSGAQDGAEKPRVAVVEVMGPLEQRATAHLCGFTDGYDAIEARFRAAADSVGEGGTVVMVVDSPGGAVAGGLPAIRRMRAYADSAGVQVEAVADEIAASMGLAILAIGDRLHVPAHGRTGSIGTVIIRAQSDAQGVEVFRSGDRKMRPNSIEPLDKDDRADLQEKVDQSALAFAGWVAERRGKSAEHWLSLKGASLSGEAALRGGLIDTNLTAHEVIEMALADAARASMAEALGLEATASESDIMARVTALRGAEGKINGLARDLDLARAAQAKAESEKMALEETIAREKASLELASKRAAFASDVAKACSSGLITPPREAALLAHYDAHGEAAARGALELVRASTPIVRADKPGVVPGDSSAGDTLNGLTAAELAHCKARGLDPILFAERKGA